MDGSPERDQSIERLLRQSRSAPATAGPTDACLDAERLAAWMDGGLSGAALDLAQSHVADCARCQALVGTFVRVDAAVPRAVRERASRRWLAWLVPLTAATAALAVWVAVPRDVPTNVPVAAPVTAPAAAVAPVAAPAQQPAGEAKNLDTLERRKDAAPAEAPSEPKRDGPVSPPAASLRAAAPAAAPPAAAGAAAGAVQSSTVAEQALKAAQSNARAEAAGLVIVSPDPLVRWRITGPVVERSTDGGSRWEAVATGIPAEFTAGAAPSALVCWLAGRGGVVLLSTDGRSWRRVAFPEMTDLSAVRAADARTASVATADGRAFSTTDGGITWVRRPLQEF